MASPYFTPVRVRPINTAGMTEAGRAIGSSYAQMGNVIGNAISTMGNAYFEDKKLERTMMSYLQGEEGQQFLLDKGYAPAEIQDMMTGAKPLRSEVKKLFKDMGGVANVRKQVRENMEFESRMQINNAKLKESDESVKSLRIENENLKNAQDREIRERRILNHLFKSGGNIDGYEFLEQDADLLPGLAKEFNIPGLSKPSFVSYLAKLPPGTNFREATREYNAKNNVSTEQAQENLKFADANYGMLNEPVYQESAIRAIDEIEGLLAEADESMFAQATGFIGAMQSAVPDTIAHTVKLKLETIEASLGFQRLQDMRDASQTGGALGQVSEKELDLLKSSVVALRQSMRREDFNKALANVRKHYTNSVNAISAMNEARKLGRSFAPTKAGLQQAFQFMTSLGYKPPYDTDDEQKQPSQESEVIVDMVNQLSRGKSRSMIISEYVALGNDANEVEEFLKKAEQEAGL